MTTTQKPLVRTDNQPLDGVLDRRLLLYAVAAGAALAAATPAPAEVLFTPSNAVLHGPKASLAIDLDHDGAADVLIQIRLCGSFYSGYTWVPCVVASGAQPTAKIATSAHLFEAAALPRQALIFASLSHSFPFKDHGFMATTSDIEVTPWNSARDRFVGVQLSNGGTHYAWVGFRSVSATGGLHVELAGWAYETQPDHGIVAGDKGDKAAMSVDPELTSLECLAAGHVAIEQRRKRSTR